MSWADVKTQARPHNCSQGVLILYYLALLTAAGHVSGDRPVFEDLVGQLPL